MSDEIFEELSEKALRRKQRKEAKTAKQASRMPKPIQARTPRQKAYIRSLKTYSLTIAVGPAGSGKSFVPARVFGEMLVRKDIEKLYVARPNIAKPKHRMGYLPGTAEEKTAPWLIPIFEGLRDSMAKSEFERFRREKVIEEVPYEHIQGRTFRDAACIVDEAENLDLDDLYITLTRQGEDLSMVLCGDIAQARIPDSGLAHVIEMARMPHMSDIGIIEFTEDDIVRSTQAKQWAKAFKDRENLIRPNDCGNDQVEYTLPRFLTGE